MSRRAVYSFAQVLVALALAMPVAARVGTNGTKPVSVKMEFLNPITFGGTEIKPGTYTVTADDSKVTVMQNGKMLAEAPISWKDSAMKASYSNIVTVGDKVTEIHFGGKTRYAAIAQ